MLSTLGLWVEHPTRMLAERCDIHVLWGQRGVVNKFFTPIELWQAQCEGTVTGEAMPSGHFIPEELPLETVDALTHFFAVPGARS